MTETVDNGRTASTGKRRPHPKTRRRPQSRNPSAPMTTRDDPEADPAPATGRTRSTAKKPKPTRATAAGPAVEDTGRSTERARASEPEPAPAPEPAPEPEQATASAVTEGGDADAPAKRSPGSPRAPRVRAAAARARRALAHAAHRLRTPRRLALPPWWPAALCVLLGVLAGLAYGLLRPAQYTATSYVAVVPGEKGDPMTALGFAQAYGRIATDTAVLARAQEESGVPVATLRGSVDAVTSPDAPMIEITGHAPRAGEAADVANAVARSLTEVADDSADATGVELTAFSRARAPREPSTPSPVLTTAVGGSAGVLVGALVLLVRPRRAERSAGSTIPAPAGEAPADRASRAHQPVREKEPVR